MGKPTGFLEIERQDRAYLPVADRIQHCDECVVPLIEDKVRQQGARCMDCGIPYCHKGCPINNIIPDWNDLVYRGKWREAVEMLHSTNNFPEITGRICPAPCEASCTLNISDQPVTIKTIECAIIDKAWQQGWIEPQIHNHRTGKKIAIVGSGPAGLACAQQLIRVGHSVSVYEKNDRLGGLLRYGIPDFKLEKSLIDRRLGQLRAEGVMFHQGVHIGKDISIKQLKNNFDVIVLAGGSEQSRNLDVPGRQLRGINFAMDFLPQHNHRVAGDAIPAGDVISAKGKNVVILGGGDTGSDCIGTSIRQGASSVTQLEIMPRPPVSEDKALCWPNWPTKLRTSSSQEEGCMREWSVATQSFSGDDGNVAALNLIRLDWVKDDDDRWQMHEIAGSEYSIKADLVLLAMGFVHPVFEGMLKDSDVELDKRGNVKANTDNYKTSIDGIFAAGDMRRGQSLVVWAIREGRQVARAVDLHLMNTSNLPLE